MLWPMINERLENVLSDKYASDQEGDQKEAHRNPSTGLFSIQRPHQYQCE